MKKKVFLIHLRLLGGCGGGAVCYRGGMFRRWIFPVLLCAPLLAQEPAAEEDGPYEQMQILARAMQHLGWGIIRGSTTRKAVPALMRLLREDRRHICITPDGPRGPRRTMAPGPIFLASRLGLPLVCMGYGYDRPWRAKSWDRFAIPRPFTRGRAVFGPPLRVPANLDRDGLERYRVYFERLLNWLTDEAEAWATSGRSWSGEAVMAPRYTPLRMQRPPSPSAPPLPPELAGELRELPQARRVAA